MKRIDLICISGLIASIGLGTACKPRSEQSSRVKDLNPGQMMNDEENSLDDMKKGRKVVVIYYANDTFVAGRTDPAFENLDDLTRLLEDASRKESDTAVKAQLSNLAKRLNNDWDRFNKVVNDDVKVLTNRLCSSVGPNYKNSVAGLAVFRNSTTNTEGSGTQGSPTARYLRELNWQSCRPGQALRPQAFKIPRFDEFPYDSQPFSNSASLELALQSVKGEFNPQEHRFILITKSHGSKENALVPHLSVDLRDRIKKDPDKVLAAIKNGTSDATGLDSWKTDTILDGIDEILKKKLTNVREKGISKIEYLRILNSLGQVSTSDGESSRITKDGPMMFPIVLMESCKSDLKFSRDSEIEQVLTYYGNGYKGFNMHNVGLLYTSDEKGLGYDEIKYPELMGWLANHATDFQDLFKTLLDSKAKKGTN